MRDTRSTWRTPKITVHFANVKALVYWYLRNRDKPIKSTGEVFAWCERWGKIIGVNVTYKMTLEALHELDEQGFIDSRSTREDYYWWSRERIGEKR